MLLRGYRHSSVPLENRRSAWRRGHSGAPPVPMNGVDCETNPGTVLPPRPVSPSGRKNDTRFGIEGVPSVLPGMWSSCASVRPPAVCRRGSPSRFRSCCRCNQTRAADSPVPVPVALSSGVTGPCRRRHGRLSPIETPVVAGVTWLLCEPNGEGGWARSPAAASRSCGVLLLHHPETSVGVPCHRCSPSRRAADQVRTPRPTRQYVRAAMRPAPIIGPACTAPGTTMRPGRECSQVCDSRARKAAGRRCERRRSPGQTRVGG